MAGVVVVVVREVLVVGAVVVVAVVVAAAAVGTGSLSTVGQVGIETRASLSLGLLVEGWGSASSSVHWPGPAGGLRLPSTSSPFRVAALPFVAVKTTTCSRQ